MTSIGERLRRQRVERGFDLGQVARETKINPKLLEAIEAEEFEKLPGGVFRKSFVRQYARALGLDEASIAAELEQIAPVEEPMPLLRQDDLGSDIPGLPTPASQMDRRWVMTSVGSFVSVVAVMMICAGIYSWWQNSREAARTVSSASANETVPQATPPPPEATRPAAQMEPAPGALAPAVAQVPGQPVPEQSVTPGMFRVDLAASEPVWVSVIADGKQAYVGTLEGGEAKSFEGLERIRMRVGNAGGLQVNLNGKPVGEIGPRGQIRIVEITPSGSQVSAPVKPPPAPADDASEEEETPATPTAPPPAQPARPPSPDSSTQRLIG